MAEPTDQLPLQGPRKGNCGCGCSTFGTLRVRPWRNGITCVRTGCPCKSCLGKRSQSRGRRSQGKAAKRGGFKNVLHEEWTDAAHRWTHKEDKAHADVVYRVWDRLVKEDNYKRPIGDNRPLVQTFSQPGRSGGLVVVEDNDDAIYALAVQRGLLDPV